MTTPRYRATVALSAEALGRLLNLREGITITSARFDSETEQLVLFLESDQATGLPAWRPREQPLRVPLASLLPWELQP